MDDKTRPVDIDPEETREWIESLEAVLQQEGVERSDPPTGPSPVPMGSKH